MSNNDRPAGKPWQYSNRDWCGREHPHNYYITGGHHESYEYDEEGELVNDGQACTAVAIVVGNEASGGIPGETAKLICRAVNSHDGLLGACKAMLADIDGRGEEPCWCLGAEPDDAGSPQPCEACQMREAVRKAEESTP